MNDMPRLNENYLNLKESYLFSEIAHRTAAYAEKHPQQGAQIIRLGIGDVTKPLGKTVLAALHEGVDAMGSSETFKGYGPEQGYEATRNAIAAYYKRNGVNVDPGDIFVSDGAKSDTGNITDLFGPGNVILIPDLSGLRGHQHHVRQRSDLPERQCRKSVSSHAGSGAACGHYLPVLAQQPDRRLLQQGTTEDLGRLRASEQRRDPL